MKRKPLIPALWAICSFILLSIPAWSANENTNTSTDEAPNCSISLTATPIGVYCGETTGSIDITITGGTAPYKIEWDNNDSSIWAEISTNDNTYTIPDLPRGMYKISIRDKNGCRDVLDVMMDDNASDLTYTIETNDPCSASGSMVIRVAGSEAPYWVILDGPTSGGVIANSNAFRIDNLLPGAYNVRVDKDGCGHDQTTTIITTPTALGISLAQMDYNVCDELGDVKVNITGGTSEYLISWYGASSGSTRATESKIVQNLVPGDYTFTIRDANFCTSSATVTVVSTGNNLYCELTQTPAVCDNMGQVGVAINGGKAGYTVSYSGPVSGAFVANSDPTNNTGDASIWDLPPGEYHITIKDSRGCVAKESIVVGGELTDLACIVTQTPVICDDMGQIGVAISGGYPAYRVEYSGPISGSVVATTTGDRTGNASILNLPAGHYTIKVVDSRGCVASEGITVGGTITDLACIVTQTPVLCDNMGEIGVSINGGYPTYRINYSGPKTGSVIATTTGDRSAIGNISHLPAGYYTIVVTDSRGCSATETITVGETGSDLECVVDPQPQICNTMGGMGISISGGTPYYQINYTGPSSGVIVVAGSGSSASTTTIPDLPAGDYTVVVTDANGCSVTEIIIIGDDGSNLTCDVLAQPQICESNAGVYVTISGGKPSYAISYTGSASGTVVASSTGTTFIPLPFGDYTITVVDGNGCSASETATVGTGTNDLHCRLEKTHFICHKPGTIEVIISGGKPGFTVTWSTVHGGGATVFVPGFSYLFEVPCPGVYDITVTDANGCVVMESTEVKRLENNLAYQVFANPGVQEGNGWLEIYFQQGRAPYTVDLTGPVNETQIINGAVILSSLPSGLYSINITDANGCEKQTYVEVPKVGPDIGGMRIEQNNTNSLSKDKQLLKSMNENLQETPLIFENKKVSNEFVVYQNFPNPFKLSTTISFNLPRAMKVTITIHDHMGKIINSVESDFSKGYNQYEFSRQDLGKGIYYYTVSAEKFSKTIRMLHIE